MKSYRSWRVDDTTDADARGRLKQLEWVATLREDGCGEATALAAVGGSRATYNGCVERANATSRYEFYPFYEGPLTVAAINRKLAEYQQYYNTYRPHDGIGLLTPMEYYQQLTQPASESHMY